MARLEFRFEKVTGRVTRIFAPSAELMYLVEGDERAALIDTGSGIGFVRPLVERLTDKPLIVLITHGHVDHAMGASEFPPESVYINQEDAYIYGPHSTYEFRKDGLSMMEGGGEGIGESDFTPIQPIEAYHDLKDGDVFPLGGLSVEAIACPGHTKGSMVMLIPEERMLLTGDACNGFTFLFQDYSLPVEAYQESLRALQERVQGRYDSVLASHGDGRLDRDVIAENIAVCGDIMAGRAARIPFAFRGDHGLIAKGDNPPGHGNIVYHPDRIRR